MNTLQLGDRPLGLRRDARAVLRSRRVDGWLWRIPVVTATFVSKVAIPPFGALGLSIAIPVLFAASCVGAATGRFLVDFRRLLAYLSLLVLLWTLQVLRDGTFSPASMLLLTVLHLPYVFYLRRTPDYAKVIDYFQSIAMVIAVLGLLQYTVQFLVGSQIAFPIENYFPEAFRVSAFNMQGSLEYGSDVYRTNGVFMLEPSFFSQFIAVAVIIEITTRRRLWAVALMVVSMLLSYSGTGLALLGACLLVLAIVQRRWSLLAGLGAGAVLIVTVAGMIGNVPYISVFLSRAGEFSSQGSSGFARFVGGFYMFDQFLWGDPLRAMTGFGAGSFQSYSVRSIYPASGMAVFKMIFEFGVVGATAYFGFLYYCVSRSTAPLILRVAVGLTYLLSGNYIPFGHALAFSLLIWTAPSQSHDKPAP